MERPEMVNTAKQCFLESLVCFIGFSCEDPNFRAWIGWLKDVIGQVRLCPTYLVTYSKGFHDAEKASMKKYQYPSGTIINQIKVSMFSKDDIIQAECIRAFFVMADDGIDVVDIVSYIFDNLMLADERAY